MHYLYEESDFMNTPVECFYFDTLEEQFPVPPHWHYFAELIYMLEGKAEMHNNDSVYIVSEGEMIVFPPKSVHSIYPTNEEHIRYAAIKCDINKLNMTPAYAPKLRSIFKSASRNGVDMLFSAKACAEADCKGLFIKCIEECKKHRYGYDLVVNAALYEIMVFMIRIWLEQGFSINNDVFAEDNAYDIDVITEFIDSRMNENLSVSDIAERCGMSYSHFAKKFHSVYGMSCKEYIDMMRMFKVEEFLLFTDFDLNYISQETGFSDCSHMIKCFKRFHNITPKQFRIKKEMSKKELLSGLQTNV